MPTRQELEQMVEAKRRRAELEAAVEAKRNESVPRQENPSPEMMVRSLAKGWSGGISEPVISAMKAYPTQALMDNPDYEYDPKAASERYQADMEAASKERAKFPITSGALEFGAGFLPSSIPGKVMGAAKGVGQSVVAGLGLGATNELTKPESEQNADNAITNTMMAGGLSGVGKFISNKVGKKALEKSGEWSEDAAKAATRALGRPKPSEAAAEKASGADITLGKEMLKEKIIPWFGSTGRISKRLQEKISPLGEKLETLYDDASKLEQSGRINAKEIASILRTDPDYLAISKTPGLEGAVKKIDKYLQTLESNGENLTIKEARQLRKSVDDAIHYGKLDTNVDTKAAQDSLKQQRGMLRDSINSSVDSLFKEAGFSDKVGQLAETNKKISPLLTANKRVESQLAREQTNRGVSLTDTLAGVGAIASGNWQLAPLLAAGNKAGRMFGNSLKARGLDLASMTASEVSDFLSKNPEFVPLFNEGLRQGTEDQFDSKRNSVREKIKQNQSRSK